MRYLKKGFLAIAFMMWAEGSFSQSLSFSFPDTIVYGSAVDSSALSCWTNDFVTNLTGQVVTLDVVRVQDDTAAQGWTSAFCFQICSQPFVDSIRATMGPNEVVNIAIHFIITGVPDSATILMKYKNVSNPTEVFYQRFYGISQSTAAINSLADPEGGVHIYPSPVKELDPFTLVADPKKFGNRDLSLSIFNLLGEMVGEKTGLKAGANTLDLDLPAGLYVYSLGAGQSILNTGKFLILK